MNDIPTFTIYSNELGGNATLEQAAKECGGKNISPQLSWINSPKETKSFAITIHDKDAPTGGGFWHWIVFNIPSKIQTLPSDAGDPAKNLIASGAIQSKNDYGYYGYGGPNPPAETGNHQYLITIYALDIEKLDADKDTLANVIGFKLWSHTIEKASMVLYYKHQ